MGHRAHQPGAWTVCVQQVSAKAPGQTSNRDAAGAEPGHGEWRAYRVQAQARLEGRDGEGLHAGAVDQLYEGTSWRTRNGKRVVPA
jgi:hypothetical protein